MKTRPAKHSQRGAVHVLVAMLAIPLIACMALAVDGFLLITSNLQQNNNAEYAALAALKEMRAQSKAGTPFSQLSNLAIQRAESVAGSDLNRYVGRRDVDAVDVNTKELQNKKAGAVRFGQINPTTGVFIVGGYESVVDPATDIETETVYTAVEVKLNTVNDSTRNSTIKTMFAGVIGAHDLAMKSVAYACHDPKRDAIGLSSFSLCKPTSVRDPVFCDTNGDGVLTQADVTPIRDTLNRYPNTMTVGNPGYRRNLDTNNNNRIEAFDALVCINRLNSPT